MRKLLFFGLTLSFFLLGCTSEESDPEVTDYGANPFLEVESGGKADTGYFNARGVEMHVTLEADIDSPNYKRFDAPADLAQFATTFLRKNEKFYIELLAEDAATPERVEWLVDGEWIDYEAAKALDRAQLTHFRLRGVNAVLLYEAADEVQAGSVFEAPVPKRPYQVMEEGGVGCASKNSHIELSQSIYWYLWNPYAFQCDLDYQMMSITVEEVLPKGFETYPEYDQLWADNTLTVVVLFAKLDDGNVENDGNWEKMETFVKWLEDAGFTESEDAELGRRFVKEVGELKEIVDVYGPDLFYSVADRTRFDNWQKAVSEHEVVMYNGHSVLGAGYAFEAVEYPDFYQIFQIGSCLSYEYYVRPVLAGKGDWANVDVLSNVEPTYYHESLPLVSTTLAKLIYGFENQGRTSWQDIMEAVSYRLGHSRFGVSGARGNCFSPDGSLCEISCVDHMEEGSCQDAGCFWAECPEGLTCDQPYVCAEPPTTTCEGYIDEENCAAAGCEWAECPAELNCDRPNICQTPIADLLVIEGEGGVDIPDNEPAGMETSLEVSDDEIVQGLSLQLDLDHTWTGDLIITLAHGDLVHTLWNKEGGSNDNIKDTFETDLFNGQTSLGLWTLKIVDTENADTGALNTWSITITK